MIHRFSIGLRSYHKVNRGKQQQYLYSFVFCYLMIFVTKSLSRDRCFISALFVSTRIIRHMNTPDDLSCTTERFSGTPFFNSAVPLFILGLRAWTHNFSQLCKCNMWCCWVGTWSWPSPSYVRAGCVRLLPRAFDALTHPIRIVIQKCGLLLQVGVVGVREWRANMLGIVGCLLLCLASCDQPLHVAPWNVDV